MLNTLKKCLVPIGLLCLSLNCHIVFAQQQPPSPGGYDEGQLPTLIKNFASYFGYTIANGVENPSSKLIEDTSKMLKSLENTVYLSLGTRIAKTIVDPTNQLASNLNPQVNAIFKEGTYSSTNPSQGASQPLTVTPLIDEPPYQSDPIRQTIVNLTTTPEFSSCTKISCSNPAQGQEILMKKCCSQIPVFRGQIGINVLNTLPTADLVFNPPDASTISQLDVNSMIEPLLYTTADNSKQSPQGSSGLTANNQAQVAQNYIRYATDAVSPPEQITYDLYEQYYKLATNPATNSADIAKAAKAQSTIANYIGGWRSFASQKSVAVANLYYILSKRMPQTPQEGSEATSQALNEFRMATKRLYDPSAPKQWTEEINSASAATVQKEIVMLLAEINYQLYLSRQAQERLLLTDSIMLIQLSRMVQPAPHH